MPRPKWQNQFSEIESASKFHNDIRKIFAKDPFFKALSCYQEVPLVDLVPSFCGRSLFVDWYIHELNAALELHGKQHYELVNFGNLPYHQAERNFREAQYRDSLKQQALEEAGYSYHVIPYTDKGKLNGHFLKQVLLG